MSEAAAVDEKDAILSLLGLHGAPSPEGPPASEAPKTPKTVDDRQSTEHSDTASDDDDDDQSTESSSVPCLVRSPVYDCSPDGLHRSDDENDPAEPEPPINAPTKAMSSLGVDERSILMKNIGKKRKHHCVMDGQFEDAEEGSEPIVPPMSVASSYPASGADELVPPSKTVEITPPHSIKQIFKESFGVLPHSKNSPAMTRLPNPSSMLGDEQFRQLMFLQQHQQQKQFSMMQEGAFSNPYFAALMANSGSMSSIRSGELPMDQQRLQMEAMMAFQAQMAFASRQHLGVNAPPSGVNPTSIMMSRMHSHVKDSTAGVGDNNKKIVTPPLGSASSSQADTSKKQPSSDAASSGTKVFGHPPAAVAAITAAVAAESDDPGAKGSRKHPTTGMHRPEQPSPASKKGRISDSDNDDNFRMKETSVRAPGLTTKIRYQKYKPPVSWRELAQVPKMPAVEPDTEQKNLISNLRDHDVLLGRGGLTNTNPGNVRFRALVSKHRLHYCMAPKGDKGALGRYLANYVRAMGGRFLAKASKDDESWYEVGDDQATKKCAQALREGTAEFNRREHELL